MAGPVQQAIATTSTNAVSMAAAQPTFGSAGTAGNFVLLTFTTGATGGTAFTVTSVGGTLPVANWAKAGTFYSAGSLSTSLEFWYGWISAGSPGSPTVNPTGSSGTSFWDAHISEWANIPPGSKVTVNTGTDNVGANTTTWPSAITAPAGSYLVVTNFGLNNGAQPTSTPGGTALTHGGVQAPTYIQPPSVGSNTVTYNFASAQPQQFALVVSPGVPLHQQRTFVPRARASFF